MGVLVEILFKKNKKKLTSSIQEKVYRTLRIWTKKCWIPEIYDEIFYLLNQSTAPSNELIMKNLLSLYSSQDYTPKDQIPINKPFDFLKKRQESTIYDEYMDEQFENLSVDIYRSTLKNIPVHLYNLLFLYPLSVAVLRLLLDFTGIKNDEKLLEAIIYAFEKSRNEALKNPSKDFYSIGDNRIYILSLDSLAYIYKQNGQYKDAYLLYEKILKYDLSDRFMVKESVLICYVYLGMMDKLMSSMVNLDDESPYKKLLMLYAQIDNDQPYAQTYLLANDKHESILNAICYGYDPLSDDLSENDKFFLDDFYPLYTYNKKVMEKLKLLHVENILM
jgi:tetratricopeptide (TPR) repeat protein